MNENYVTLKLEDYNKLRDFSEMMQKDFVCSSYPYEVYITKDQAIAELTDTINCLENKANRLEKELKIAKVSIGIEKSSDSHEKLIAIKELLMTNGFWNRIKLAWGIVFGNEELNELIKD